MDHITGSEVSFQYKKNRPILENASFSINNNTLTAILGKNGSGKSTLVKLISALLPLTSGKITVNGRDLNDSEGIRYIRDHFGIIFQNPDNQFVAPILEDDIMFGLDIHNIPKELQEQRIKNSLEKVNLSGYEKRNLLTLSGGEKQRAAAAGIIALDNDVYIFDESTSMLDPQGKKDLLKCIFDLRTAGKTVILITQEIREVINADKIILIADHKIIGEGAPENILTNIELLTAAGIQVPFPVKVYNDLLNRGIKLRSCPLTVEALAEEICSFN